MPKQQEISDCQIVQFVRDERMLTDTIEGITEDHARTDMGVVKGFDAHMVAGAEQLSPQIIPNSEGEITKQALDTIRAPAAIATQDQFRISPIRFREIIFAGRSQCREEIFTSVDPCVRNDPSLAIQGQWL